MIVLTVYSTERYDRIQGLMVIFFNILSIIRATCLRGTHSEMVIITFTVFYIPSYRRKQN